MTLRALARLAFGALVLAVAGCPKKKADPVAPVDTVDAAITIVPAAPSANLAIGSAIPSVAPSASAAPRLTDCITVDTSDESGGAVLLEGKVYSGKHSHPNGSMFTFFGLLLATPRCVVGLDEPTTTDVQLMSMDDIRILRRYDGARVRITGSAFPEHTAWHVRPVVVSVDTIAKIR